MIKACEEWLSKEELYKIDWEACFERAQLRCVEFNEPPPDRDCAIRMAKHTAGVRAGKSFSKLDVMSEG